MKSETRIAELERVIPILDTLYEEGKDCLHPDTGILVTDGEYDGMRRELKSLKPNSKLFVTATASKMKSGVQKVKHDPPMTSIEKASHEDYDKKLAMLEKWMEDCLDGIPKAKKPANVFDASSKYFSQSYKLDGVALSLYYENGVLKTAGLRPRDGVNGEDVTEQVQYVAGVPKRLPLPLTCAIRGEIICKLSDFERVQAALKKAGEPLRANPRNHAAGGIRQFKDPRKTLDARLTFMAYSIIEPDNFPPKTEVEIAKWVNKSAKLGVAFVQTRPFNFDDLKKMEDYAAKLDYEVDGIVISVNVIEDQEMLGRHGDKDTGNPKGKIAWKFAEETASPVIKEIEWGTGRTGAVKPVAIFDGVQLDGTNVQRATLHNYGFMKRGCIDVGTKISVLKAGKIIPKVIGVLKNPCKGEPDYPKTCPSCGEATDMDHTPAKGKQDEMWEVMCNNPDCPAQHVHKLAHYLSEVGALGLGEARIIQLAPEINRPADFYRLTVQRAMGCGLSKRQAMLALATIHMILGASDFEDDDLLAELKKVASVKKNIAFWKIFSGFGISSAGKSAGKELIAHFHSFDAIRGASVEELAEVDGVGEKTAEIVHAYLRKHRQDIDALLRYVEPVLPKTGSLTGKKFVLSGSFDAGKKHWQDQIEDQGGKCSSGVSKTTSFLVAGPGSGSKSDKAKQLGVKSITEKELEKMLR